MAQKTKLPARPKPPKGWFLAGDTPELYEASVDTSNPHSGTKCAYVRTTSKAKKGCQWTTLMQQMAPEDYLSKRIQMTCWVKTKDVTGYVQPWMRVDGKSDDILSFDNMCNRYLKGTTDWTEYSIVLDVPAESTNIAFGIILGGAGELWLDDVSFKEVGMEVPITDCPCSPHSKTKRRAQNLNFEEDEGNYE